MASSKMNSRFSTLKVFKFNNSKSTARAPPPPPKDDFYLYNRPLATLSPDSIPTTPMTPYSNVPRQPSPSPSPSLSLNPNQSVVSLVSDAASINPPAGESSSVGKKGGPMGLFKFGKRSLKTPSINSSSEEGSLPAPSQEDDNISLPWNFQVSSRSTSQT
jgi:hypothetical protein